MFESLQRWFVRIFQGNDRGGTVQCSAIPGEFNVKSVDAPITKVIIRLPDVEEPEALSPQAVEQLETSCREWISGDRRVLILPPGAEIEFFDIKR